MDEATNETKLQRKTTSYESRDKEFLSIYTTLSSQFFSLYQHRLHAISPALRKKAIAAWPGKLPETICLFSFLLVLYFPVPIPIPIP
jgi:hypothetical protein